MTRPATVRLIVAVPLTLAVLLSAPTQRVVAGVDGARAGMTSSLGGDASLHRTSNGKIAFLGGFTDGSLDVVNPDGSGLRRLARCTTRGCWITDPVWSPDGRRIAFFRGTVIRNSYLNISLYVMNANGSGERRLAPCGGPGGCSTELAWSPNGTDLAIAYGRALYVFDLNTGRLRLLSAAVKVNPVTRCCAPTDRAPAWSPDGSRIAFARTLGGCGAGCATWPYIVNADGTGLKRLSSLPSGTRHGRPLWSPDGRTIAFVGRNRIYAINPDGSHLRLLVHAPPDANQLQELASWSPDGRHILYTRTPWSCPGGPHPGGSQAAAVWIMNANGTGQRRLYLSRGSCPGIGGAAWSPDGQLIVFSGGNASRSGVFVMSADGRHLRRITTAGLDFAWQPIP